MRVAYCLYGFIAEEVTQSNLNSLREAFPIGTIIDIYYSCPSILHEQYPEEVNKSQVESEFTKANLGKVVFDWRIYNPSEFINHVNKKNLSKKSEVTNQYYYRLLSMFYGISKSVSLINAEDTKYDAIVVTRYSYIKFIRKLSDFDTPLKKGVYIYRDGYYRGYAEDRIFYGNYTDFICVKDIYQYIVENINEINAYPEKLIEDFFKLKYDDSELYKQAGIHPFDLAPLLKEYKRSDDCRNLVDKTYLEVEKNLNSKDGNIK